MAVGSQIQAHRHWGNYATAADLPNVSGSSTQHSALEVGDLAYVTGTTTTYQCTTATPGSAVWSGMGGTDSDAIHDNVAGEIVAVATKGSPTTSDYLLIEDAADSNNKKKITIGTLPSGGGNLTEYDWASNYNYNQQATPVEEVAGKGVLNGSNIQSTAYFRAIWDPQFSLAGSASIKLYDLGPSSGPPGTPVLITTFTRSSSGLYYSEQALTVAGSPGTNQIQNTSRMYEVTVYQSSAAADTVDLGSAGITDR